MSTPVDTWGNTVMPPPQKPRRPVGMGDVVLGLVYSQLLAALAVVAVIAISITQLRGLTMQDVEGEIDAAISSPPAVVLALLATWAGFLLATWWASTHKGDGDWRSVLSWGFSWRTDVLIAVAFVAVFRGVEWMVSLALAATGVDTSELSNTGLVTDFTGGWLVVMAIAAIVGAPLVEELFFRGLFLTTARRRLGTAGGVLLSSVVFGVLHAQTTPAASAYTITATTLIGVGLAVLVVRTGRLGTAITSHVLMNASGVALAMIAV